MIGITPSADNRFFYGWYIVGVSLLANFMSVGSGFYVFNAFMEPLCQLRGWSRADINSAMAVGTLVGFLGQFIYGTLIVRIGPRILMSMGALVSGVVFILLMQVEQLWKFYLLYILLFLGNGAYGGIVASTAVNNWFVGSRGRALGLTTAGISLSGAILPLVTMMMIIHTSMTGAALCIGLMIMSISPLAWALIKDWPENYGMAPFGSSMENADRCNQSTSLEKKKIQRSFSSGQPMTVLKNKAILWGPLELIRTGAFWKLGTSFALIMAGIVGVMSQLKPRFTDIGFSDMAAMGLMAATALFGALGKYFWGMTADRFEPRRVVAVLAIANCLGLTLAFYSGSLPFLLLFVVIFGFSMGGIMSTYPILVASLFGRESFPSVLRFVSLFLVFQLSGYLIAGMSYELTGTYDRAYQIFIFFDLVAAFLIMSVRKPKMRVVRIK